MSVMPDHSAIDQAERLATAIEAGGLGIWEFQPATGRVDLSSHARALIGLTHGRPVHGRDVLRAIATEDRRSLLSAAIAWPAPGAAPEIDQRLKLRDRDGEPRWIAIRGRLIADPQRPLVVTAIGIVRDVTEREELLRQKDSLMAELNHRTKNSLQLVASLLRLESRGIEDPDSRRRFVEASTRVGSIAAVHDGLDRTADLKRVRLGPLVRRLCDDLAGIRCRDDVVRVDPLIDAALETDRAIPLAIILNELVTNALTYGRRRDGIATVKVGMSVCDGDTLLLSVADEGPGLPSDFALSRPCGLGLQLVTALTRQIGGRIDVDTDQEGVTFQIRFPADQHIARP